MQPPAPPPSKHDKADKDEETLKVYDGNQGLRRRLFRPVSVQKSATVDQVMTKTLHLIINYTGLGMSSPFWWDGKPLLQYYLDLES